MNKLTKFDNYLKSFESNEFDQKTIIHKLIKVLAYSKDYNEYIENMYNINDLLYWYGYPFQFLVPNKEKEKDYIEEFVTSLKGVSKSVNSTQKLVGFLNKERDYRLTLSSLQRLKTSFLIDLKILPSNNEIINENKDKKFYDLYFLNYNNLELREILDSSFKLLGLDYIECDYMRFRIDMEYVLYSINFKEKSQTYKRINTIKVGLNICPRKYYIWDDKIYYNEQIALYINKYLKQLDKKVIQEYKIKYKNIIDDLDDTGYKLLFNML